MAAGNFARVMDHILRFEGGFANHPQDPGGATNMGITRKTLGAFRGREVSVEDVGRLGQDEAMAIYRRNYWDVVRGDDLPAGLDFCVMDGAVNSGPARAVRWLQQAVGTGIDGIVGPATLTKAQAMSAPDAIMHMCDERLIFLKGLGTWAHFGRGWSRRVETVRKEALAMVEAEAAQADVGGAPVARSVAVSAGGAAVLASGLLTLAVSLGLLPPEFGSPDMAAALAALFGAVGAALAVYRGRRLSASVPKG